MKQAFIIVMRTRDIHVAIYFKSAKISDNALELEPCTKHYTKHIPCFICLFYFTKFIY
ncbi:hypothetical protein AwWohl_04180 [Gammaproteobacteria bacterium]|nr:hypothetical protein AwWohl_04180 [Gammaproteobacteria bacterium]